MRNNYIFGLLCMIKCHVCVSAFPCACERTCVGILYVSALVCLCVCLSFVLNALFNLSQTSPGKKERKKKPFSYQVKSHGKLTEHCLYHPAAAHAWLESKHSWSNNMHCPHVHREYIFCITSTRNYGVLTTFVTQPEQ